tara:strand:+ start:2263 stop:2661 length:399 start_codon:yes stop_codon:yes gene_type:complete
MPRKGKGSKSQPVRTAQDQQYGQATQQAQAQATTPLPQNVGPEMDYGPTPQPRPVAGEMGSPFRGSDRPREPVQTMPGPAALPELPPERARLLAPAIHVLYALANNAYADPDLQATVRRMENFIPTKYDQTP